MSNRSHFLPRAGLGALALSIVSSACGGTTSGGEALAESGGVTAETGGRASEASGGEGPSDGGVLSGGHGGHGGGGTAPRPACEPAEERCNGRDDDCDGQVDDLPALTCGVGACRVEAAACVDGSPGECRPGEPSDEICDGLDNDCNGDTDETFANQGFGCDTGLPGECAQGAWKCRTKQGATTEICVPLEEASDEACNGLDDDCDGEIDDVEGVGEDCDTGLLGACAAGVLACGAVGLSCLQSTAAAPHEICGDGVDDDCDGTADDGCLFTFSGVATEVPTSALSGWSVCYQASYTDLSSLATVESACTKAKLLLGCRPTGAATLTVAAQGARGDVLYATGPGNVTHIANGVAWYYDPSSSWGFAPSGAAVSRSTCDTVDSSYSPDDPATDGAQRLCWHTQSGSFTGGWRCGLADSLNDSDAYERLVYQAD